MHTFKGTNGTVILHDGDYGGSVKILADNEQIVPYDDRCAHITIDAADIIEFVAEYVRSQKISELEDMSAPEIFDIWHRGRLG